MSDSLKDVLLRKALGAKQVADTFFNGPAPEHGTRIEELHPYKTFAHKVKTMGDMAKGQLGMDEQDPAIQLRNTRPPILRGPDRIQSADNVLHWADAFNRSGSPEEQELQLLQLFELLR